jgi:hypothetical protein
MTHIEYANFLAMCKPLAEDVEKSACGWARVTVQEFYGSCLTD